MGKAPGTSRFETTLHRRGRTTVDGTLNGQPFRATLEPDGQRGHWLRVDEELREAAGAAVGQEVELEIAPAKPEPEPEVPADFAEALAAWPEAEETRSGRPRMTLESWAYVADIVGAIAVVASLIYVGIQIRDSNRVNQANARHQISEFGLQVSMFQAQHADRLASSSSGATWAPPSRGTSRTGSPRS